MREFSCVALDSFRRRDITDGFLMLFRNYAKPFCITGFILAEIYMLLVVLAPYGHEPSRGLPAPIPFEATVPVGTPPPPAAVATRIVVAAVFFGPLGALVGLGIGLLFSAAVQWLSPRNPATQSPRGE
jgi:hypothetical protein